MSKKSLKTNAILNAIRQSCSVVFPLTTFPYISRILGGENYGKYSFANSIISYFSLLSALGVSNYAVREGARIRDQREKIQSFSSQVFTINVISTTVSYALLALTILFAEKLSDYKDLLIVLSANLVLTTLGVEWIYTIYEDFLFVTVRSIVVQLISMLGMFALVRKSGDYVIYACITVVASGFGNIINLFYAKKYIKLHLTLHPHLSVHLRPLLILFCNSLMISIYVNSDTTIIGLMLGDLSVGIYSVAAKIYTIIKNLLNAVIVVLVPRLSYFLENGDKYKYSNLLSKSFTYLITILIPAITGLFMVSEDAILIISGNEYVSGTMSLRILCVALGFSVLASFFSMLVLLTNKRENKTLFATIVSSLTNLVLNFIFIPLLGINGAAITTALAECIVFFITSYYSKDIFELSKNLTMFKSVLIGCVGIIVVCALLNLLKMDVLFDAFSKIVCSVLVYTIIQLVFKNPCVSDLIHKKE